MDGTFLESGFDLKLVFTWDADAQLANDFVRKSFLLFAYAFITLLLSAFLTLYVCYFVDLYVSHFVSLLICKFLSWYDFYIVCYFVHFSLCTFVTLCVCYFVRLLLCTFVTLCVCFFVRIFRVCKNCRWTIHISLHLPPSQSRKLESALVWTSLNFPTLFWQIRKKFFQMKKHF